MTRLEGQDVTSSLLNVTLAAAKQDRQTVTADGKPVRRLTHGVVLRDLPTHVDDRGSLCELFDTRWPSHPAPFTHTYCFTLRPNYVKGWNLHKQQEDRYCLLFGEMNMVLFDPRPDSPTYGEVCVISLNEKRRCLVNIPPNVWHADHNVGSVDAVSLNFPSVHYDHADPDKFRLPINTDLIPYRFEGCRGY